jgi:hypothetical protein
VTVGVTAESDLNLTLFNQRPQLGVLNVYPSYGKPQFSGTHPNGTVDVLFSGQATSQISYNGFSEVF